MRKTALALLLKMEKGAYSQLVLNAALKRTNADERDKAFLTALFYGVLERRITLDYAISRFSSVKPQKLETAVLILLRMALYQILYMNNVPASAAVNESVKLSPPNARRFVNGALRGFLRSRNADGSFDIFSQADLSVTYSCPQWLVEKWENDYGREQALKILKASFGPAPVFARRNTVKYPDFDNSGNSGNPRFILTEAPDETTDLYHVQDLSAQRCCELLNPQSGDTILDLCAAPGGKSFTIAELMGNQGRVIACDVNKDKLPLIAKGAERLGLNIIETFENDARVFNPALPKADCVLCDAPCSGLGVIRRKPEIRRKTLAHISGLPDMQKAIIATAAGYVKAGGKLMYSTCTLNRSENEEITAAFLAENKRFTLAEERVFFPEAGGGDGFYAALMRKKND